jgi:hypothetical protein
MPQKKVFIGPTKLMGEVLVRFLRALVHLMRLRMEGFVISHVEMVITVSALCAGKIIHLRQVMGVVQDQFLTSLGISTSSSFRVRVAMAR